MGTVAICQPRPSSLKTVESWAQSFFPILLGTHASLTMCEFLQVRDDRFFCDMEKFKSIDEAFDKGICLCILYMHIYADFIDIPTCHPQEQWPSVLQTTVIARTKCCFSIRTLEVSRSRAPSRLFHFPLCKHLVQGDAARNP